VDAWTPYSAITLCTTPLRRRFLRFKSDPGTARSRSLDIILPEALQEFHHLRIVVLRLLSRAASEINGAYSVK
jgi:hypothetical protein